MIDRPLTLFDARQLLGKYAVDFDASLNLALDKIYSEGTWPGLVTEITLNTHVVDNILRLPVEYETLFGADLNDAPMTIVALSLEYSKSGPGRRTAGMGGFTLVDLGPVAVETEGSYPVMRRSYKLLFPLQTSDILTGVVKRRFRLLSDDNDYIFPSSITALRQALMAVNYDDMGNQDQAAKAWEECFKALNRSAAQHRIGTPQTYAPNISGMGTTKVRGLR